MNPYHPYHDLQELLEAAGVPYADRNKYSTDKLFSLASARKFSEEQVAATSHTLTQDEMSRGPWNIRSVRIPISVEEAVDAKAKKAGTTLNALVNRALRLYLETP